MRSFFNAMLLVGALCVPVAAHATDEGSATLGFGLDVRDGTSPVGVLHRSGYPNLSLLMESRWVYLEMDAPSLILLPDAAAALVSFLATDGRNDDMPLWALLNGKTEPGSAPMFDLGLAARFAQGAGLTLETGVYMFMWFRSAFFAGERITTLPFALGPSVGFKAGAGHRWWLRTTLIAGNNWTEYSGWNPYVGTIATAHLGLGKRFGIEARGWVRRDRMDYRRYRTYDDREIAGVSPITLFGAEARLTYRLGRL